MTVSSWFFTCYTVSGVFYCRLISNFHLPFHYIFFPVVNDQRDNKSVAVLESRGSKGCKVNGKTIKKNTSYDLNSGDEVVFGLLGSHAYVSL